MIKDTLFRSTSDDWETPEDLFKALDDEFHFTLDAAASDANHKCERYFTEADDGLSKSWKGETVWCNPPYGRKVGIWVAKACMETERAFFTPKWDTTVVMLLPARTDTDYFHRNIIGKAEVRFLRGRLKFGGSKNNAPFPSMVCIWRRRKDDERWSTLR